MTCNEVSQAVDSDALDQDSGVSVNKAAEELQHSTTNADKLGRRNND